MIAAESQPINLLDYEQLARDKLPRTVYDYYAGGADDNVTLRENSAAYDRIRLRPRTLVDVTQRDTQITLFGYTLPAPLIIAPLALAGMAHPDGEIAIAKGADTVPITLSMLGTRTIEEVAGAAQTPPWLQLYIFRNRDITWRLVERAEAVGCRALVVTVDAPVAGNRERDRRNRFTLPDQITFQNLQDFALDRVDHQPGDSSVAAYATAQIDPSLSWKDIEWLRSITKLPVLLKGILRADDALCAHDHGVSGVIVSNHGGRQLDTVPASIEVLPEISAAVGEKMVVMLDSGIRRGTDIVKALAFGAQAVMIGRPILWGLAADGETGVRHVLDILRAELDTAMALCGTPGIKDIKSDLIWKST